MSRLLRGLIKTGIASTLHWTGADSLYSRHANVKYMPLVIGYHRVVEDFHAAAIYSIPPMLTSIKTFERQLDWIGRRYNFITLDDLAAWTEGTKRFDRRPVAAITFDDGYADLYHHAIPILQKKGIPAAVFVVTQLVGTQCMQTYDELYILLLEGFSRWCDPRRTLAGLLFNLGISIQVLKKINDVIEDLLRVTRILIENLPQIELCRVIEALRAHAEVPKNTAEALRSMSWEMLYEISRRDVTVGSHTRTHVYLTLENWQKVLDETWGSRLEAERKLGIPVEYFAYPSGAFNTNVVSAVAQAGYRCAFTTCRHRDTRYPILTIPRRLWWENSCMDAFGHLSPTVMSCQVSGVFDFTAPCGQAHKL